MAPNVLSGEGRLHKAIRIMERIVYQQGLCWGELTDAIGEVKAFIKGYAPPVDPDLDRSLLERDPVKLWCEDIFEECISPYLSDLGSIEAQWALEKKLREILRAHDEAKAP